MGVKWQKWRGVGKFNGGEFALCTGDPSLVPSPGTSRIAIGDGHLGSRSAEVPGRAKMQWRLAARTFPLDA